MELFQICSGEINKTFSGNDKMLTKIANKTLKVAVVGLGYVGLPLAVEFGKKFDTVGFDVKKSRLDMLL